MEENQISTYVYHSCRRGKENQAKANISAPTFQFRAITEGRKDKQGVK